VNAVRRLAAPALLLAACLAAAGCSNRQPLKPPASGPGEVAISPGPDGVQQVVISAGDDYRFSPSIVDATVGKIKLTLRHTGAGAPHTLYGAQLPGLRVPLVRAGESASIQFVASQPGRFQFVCTIHQAQGQTGTLVVAPR
jgi:plastocyanin